jgi:hypothetical protein
VLPPDHDSFISIPGACRLVPSTRGDKPTHVSTMIRWIKLGTRSYSGRRVRLQACRAGGRWVTTRTWLSDFFAALTPKFEAVPPPPRSPGKRAKASERAAAKLQEMGI